MARCLVFDLDGTLVDSVPDIAIALNALMAARSLPAFTLPDVAAMVGDGVGVLLQRAYAARGGAPDSKAEPFFMAAYAAHVADGTVAYPGIRELLAQAQAAGWRMAVCTNKPEALAHGVLRTLGLNSMFAAVGGGDSFPACKPDPAHLLATLIAAGADPAQAVMVGDHHNDVLAASGAGLPCIYAGWGYGGEAMSGGASAVARNAGEVLALAERLRPAHSSP
jgi:phosphoglycolate phosphatase